MLRKLNRTIAVSGAALLLPKCVLCVAAYAAVALGFSRAGLELCGGSATGAAGNDEWLVGAVAAAAVLVVWTVRRIFSRSRSKMS